MSGKKNFWKDKTAEFKIGFVITVIVVALGIVGLFWTPYGTTDMHMEIRSQAPSIAHICGTDNLGRDIFSRIMEGFSTTLIIGISTVLIGMVAGTALGLLCGYVRGLFDEIVMRITDVIIAFPTILMALIVVSLLGTGKYIIIVALAILFIPSFAKIARSEMVRYRNADFVKSARLMGASGARIIFVHILPNAKATIITAALIGFNNAVLAEASLGYLGLGVQPPEPSLGRMITEAQDYIYNCPWYAIFPGIAIIIMILGFTMLSDSMKRQMKMSRTAFLSPHLRKRMVSGGAQWLGKGKTASANKAVEGTNDV